MTLTIGLPPEFISSSNEQFASVNDQLNAALKIKNWFGRGATTVSNGVTAAAESVLVVSQKVFAALANLSAETTATAAVFRKLDQHVLRFFEHLADAPNKLSLFSQFIKRNVAFIDFVQLASDIDYVVARRFKEKTNEKGETIKPRDSTPLIGARISFFAADIGGSLLWLQELGFLSISKAATAIGEVRIFSVVPKVVSSIPVLRDLSGLQKVASAIGEFRAFSFMKNFNCLFVTLRALDLGYALLAIDAGRRLLNAENVKQKVSAGLDLSSYLAELTLSAILLAGVTNVIGLGVAGSTCIALTVSSFLYRIANEKEIKQPAQKLAPAVAA